MPRGFAPAKKDTSQPAIEAAFIQAGWSVDDVHVCANGFDLYVAKRGHTIAVECKTGSKKRTPEQIDKADRWQGDYLWGSDPLSLLEAAEDKLKARELS